MSVLKKLSKFRAFKLFAAAFAVLCSVSITWASLARSSFDDPESNIRFAAAQPLLIETISAETLKPDEVIVHEEKKPKIHGVETLGVSALNHSSDVLEKCASLLAEGILCMFVPSEGRTRSLPIDNTVMQEHHKHRASRRAEYDQYQAFESWPEPNEIEPAAGLYSAFDNKDEQFGETPNYQSASNDATVTQAAMRAAYDMVRNRYTDALYEAKANGGEASFDTQDALGLTQAALSSAAERAFESFVRDNFGKPNFEGQSYEGMRGYFMSAFKQATVKSVKTIGRRFVQDVTADKGFKNLSLRSELLKGLDENIASAFIDTGLVAAKNSQYAFLRNLEISYRLREKSKPEYSILTVQPLYSSSEKKHNLFAQAALSHQDGRQGYTGGLGYRYIPESEDYVVGSNVFVDYQRPYNHLRASAGLDVQTSLLGASANYYKGLSDWKDSRAGFQERAMDGFDLELAGRMPFLPALEVLGRGYRWQGLDGAKDIDGSELRLEYSPVPAFTLEALVNNEDDAETTYGLGLRYNYVFGAPAEYLYDWHEQFRQKSASEYVFRKARRDNAIRVQERLDPGGNVAVPVGPGIVSVSPLNGATDVSIGTDVVLTFAADVLAGVGNLVFTDLTDGSDDFTIPVGDARVSIVNNVVTVDLSAQLLDFNSGYDVTFAAGVFTDTGAVGSPALASGDFAFTTVVDPTAGFPAATSTLAAGASGAAFTPRNATSTWQTTIDVGATPDGVIFESGATGRGIGATFGSGNLTFAAGQGNTTATGGGSIFGTFPLASIPSGLHHFVFVAKPTAVAEIGVYMDGIRIITETTAAAMSSSEWAGTDNAGYGLAGSSIRSGVDNSVLSGATLTNSLSFYSNQQPASF